MNNYLAISPTQGMRVKSLLIADTGTYEQQWRRPYETVMDRDTVTSLQERIDPRGRILPGTLSGLTNNVVQPQVQAERPIQIPNGWSEHRFRWLMIVEHEDALGSVTLEMVTGWTDHRGISHGGALDPHMVFHINSTLLLRATRSLTPVGNQTFFNVADSSHILVQHDFGGIRSMDKNYRMRPYDVLATMDRTHLTDEDMRYTNDTRSVISSQPVKSKRSNGIASHFAAGVLERYKIASVQEGYGQSEDQILEQARAQEPEAQISSDYFIQAISAARSTPMSTIFTWNDLVRMDPNVQRDEVTTVTIMGSPMQVHNTSMNIAGRGADWGEATKEAQLATILAQAVPAIMMDLAFSKIAVSSTNRTVGGQMVSRILDYQDFTALAGAKRDMTPHLQAFVARLESQVLVDLSHSGQTDFAITVYADLIGETIIDIEWNGHPNVRYAVPSFSDAMMVPLITNSEQRTVDIAGDFQTLFHNVFSDAPHNTGVPDGNLFGSL